MQALRLKLADTSITARQYSGFIMRDYIFFECLYSSLQRRIFGLAAIIPRGRSTYSRHSLYSLCTGLGSAGSAAYFIDYLLACTESFGDFDIRTIRDAGLHNAALCTRSRHHLHCIVLTLSGYTPAGDNQNIVFLLGYNPNGG